MTCIIAHRDGWMASDSLSSSVTGYRLPTVAKKITVVGNHTLIGAAGQAGFPQFAKEVLPDAAEDVDKTVEVLSKWLRENSPKPDVELLLVNNRRKLYYVSCDGVAHEVSEDFDFWAIGSGAEYAMGYLEGIAYLQGNRQIGNYVERAIAYVARHMICVDTRVQTEILNGPQEE